jgi:hypothetical protein
VTYASCDAPLAVRNSYRDAVEAALARCTPLHFSDGMRVAPPASRDPFRGQPNHRQRKIESITATMIHPSGGGLEKMSS